MKKKVTYIGVILDSAKAKLVHIGEWRSDDGVVHRCIIGIEQGFAFHLA